MADVYVIRDDKGLEPIYEETGEKYNYRGDEDEHN